MESLIRVLTKTIMRIYISFMKNNWFFVNESTTRIPVTKKTRAPEYQILHLYLEFRCVLKKEL